MFNNLKIGIVVILSILISGSSASAELQLTEPNSQNTCSPDNMWLGLTESNYCATSSSQIYLENTTPYGIYYDMDTSYDQYLKSKFYITWTINDGTGYAIVAFDYDLITPGIQLKEYTLYQNNSYIFKRTNNNTTIDIFNY